MALVSAKEMVDKAHEGHYAIPAFNLNDLEWTKAVLAGIQEANSPAILQVSEGAGKYMCGFNSPLCALSFGFLTRFHPLRLQLLPHHRTFYPQVAF